MTTTEQLYRQALEQIAGLNTGDIARQILKTRSPEAYTTALMEHLDEIIKVARDTLAQAAAYEAGDPFSGPRGERVRQELLQEARAEGRDHGD